ncbi:MAG TPA: GNAT family N-acetyltransferase [Amycolatopsis sp.]|jgi:predicted GNAT superfamily acetyltransferase
MDVQLRQAEPADYDRIITVADEWWGRPVSSILPRLFLDHFFRTSLIAEEAGSLAGFLVGLLSDSDPEAAYIHFLGVAPELRGAGLARRLYNRFFTLAEADGRSHVRAVTSPQNATSIAFHGAMGFSVTGPVAGYDGPGVDRIVFHRSLS